MARRVRTLLSLLILLGVIGWIVLSYVPPSTLSLPQYQWSVGAIEAAFRGALIVGFLIFVPVQVWLTWSTGESVRKHRDCVEQTSTSDFSLSMQREVILTALPIAFTVILAFSTYSWWQRVSSLP